MTPSQILDRLGKAKKRLKGLLLCLDLLLISTAWILAVYFVLRPASFSESLLVSKNVLPVLCAAKIFFFVRMGLYRAILRYASIHLATTIAKAVTLGSLSAYLIMRFYSNQWPSGVLVVDWLMTLLFVGTLRFLPRYTMHTSRREQSKAIKTLIYGAGDLGEAVARRLLSQETPYLPVGFIDDNPRKLGAKVHNLPVLGGRGGLFQIIKKQNVREIIVAIANLSSESLRSFIKECRTHRVLCRIAPKISDMAKYDVSINNINISDLLKRDPKDLDEAQIRRFLKGKTIMISGAGGSIGSELSRQCIRYGAGRLILIDHSEFNLYSLQEDLFKCAVPVRFCLLNVLDDALENIMKKEKPQIFFHAAAYKHVPIVEDNPGEGLLNNVQGTIASALLAEKHGVEKFVLISTDKAVRPTSVMGASKRIAELYVHNLDARSKTEFVAVRFGNVLGSSGSVIPKFIDQINRGGPVTVTHPEVTRYFMLTSEAVQLVLQAASIGNGGEIFILNMGQPVRIAEMAEDLIFLSGREPHKDIKIEFTGLRPGEKLYEELIVDETEKKTQYENITIARSTHLNWERLTKQIDESLSLTRNGSYQDLLQAIRRLVPEFIHAKLQNEAPSEVIPFPASSQRL